MKKLVFLISMLMTQAVYASCLGLPQAEKDKCLQRIIAGTREPTAEEKAEQRKRADSNYEAWRNADREATISLYERRNELLEAKREAAEQQRQQQLAAEQARRDAIAAESLRQQRIQNELLRQQAEQAAAAQQKPAAIPLQRPIRCQSNGWCY